MRATACICAENSELLRPDREVYSAAGAVTLYWTAGEQHYISPGMKSRGWTALGASEKISGAKQRSQSLHRAAL